MPPPHGLAAGDVHADLTSTRPCRLEWKLRSQTGGSAPASPAPWWLAPLCAVPVAIYLGISSSTTTTNWVSSLASVCLALVVFVVARQHYQQRHKGGDVPVRHWYLRLAVLVHPASPLIGADVLDGGVGLGAPPLGVRSRSGLSPVLLRQQHQHQHQHQHRSQQIVLTPRPPALVRTSKIQLLT